MPRRCTSPREDRPRIAVRRSSIIMPAVKGSKPKALTIGSDASGGRCVQEDGVLELEGMSEEERGEVSVSLAHVPT